MVTYYLATCQDCTPILPQPFTDPGERDTWTQAHFAATGHKIAWRDEIRGGGGSSGIGGNVNATGGPVGGGSGGGSQGGGAFSAAALPAWR